MSGVPSFCAAAAIALAAVWPLRRLALRVGLVDRPGPRKAHRRPTPYLGGCAVLAGASVIALGQPWEPAALVLLVAMAGLGLCDDARPAPVRTKLLVELALAIVAVDLGFSLQVTGLPAADGALTVLWLVGLTNSFNLLDNMDGLSSTVAASALVAMAVVAPGTAGVALPLAGAVAGFLVANLPPARLFLGDAGSLMIGFGVGLVGVRAAAGVGGTGGLVVLVAPVSVALFDTALVVVSRLRSGRPVQVGG